MATAPKKTPAKKTTTARKTAVKTTTRKTPVRRSTTVAKKASAPSVTVEANARHIQENTHEIKNNSNLIHFMYGAIIILVLIIAALAFFVGKNMGTTTVVQETQKVQTQTQTQTETNVVPVEGVVITMIDDSRCTSCKTSDIEQQLKSLPLFAKTEFIQKDFSDEGMAQYMKDNNITSIPAAIFNTNNLNDEQIVPFLTIMPDGQYTLQLPKTFNPFAEMSDKGFIILEEGIMDTIRAESYIEGNEDAKITWIEYSDLECPYCAKLHNDGTPSSLKTKYGNDLNVILQHFPLDFHANAKPGAVILECVGELSGTDNFYALAETSFSSKNSSSSFLITEAEKLGINTVDLQACIDEGKYSDKINTQQAQGTNIFGVTGTPGNVLINNETGEYQVLSGAYPASDFEVIIDKLLK